MTLGGPNSQPPPSEPNTRGPMASLDSGPVVRVNGGKDSRPLATVGVAVHPSCPSTSRALSSSSSVAWARMVSGEGTLSLPPPPPPGKPPPPPP